MFKQNVVAEVESETKRMHRYECPSDTPPSEAYHVLQMISAHVFEQVKVVEEAMAKEQKEKESKAKELDEKIESCEKVEPIEVKDDKKS